MFRSFLFYEGLTFLLILCLTSSLSLTVLRKHPNNVADPLHGFPVSYCSFSGLPLFYFSCVLLAHYLANRHFCTININPLMPTGTLYYIKNSIVRSYHI